MSSRERNNEKRRQCYNCDRIFDNVLAKEVHLEIRECFPDPMEHVEQVVEVMESVYDPDYGDSQALQKLYFMNDGTVRWRLDE